ncbi:MAG: hypothetical protein QOH26_1610 [Actinomycetota bacterium]|nr:hypothetical protein [Actinomycetota bacterium]
MSKRGQAFVLLGFPAVLAALGAALYPSQRANIVLGAIAVTLSVGLIYLLWTIGWSTKGHRPLVSLLGARSARRERPSDLASFERMLGWQVYTAPEFNHRVRPVLRSILSARLRETRGIDPDDPHARVPSLPEPLAALLPARSADVDPESKIRTEDLLVLVTRLEEL